MKVGMICALLFCAQLLGGCADVTVCDEPQFYESATTGRRIEVPDDLDSLDEMKEMVIPEASPRTPRDPALGCVDQPPDLRVE